MAPILRQLRDLKQNVRDQNSGCRPGPYRVFRHGPETLDRVNVEKQWTPERPMSWRTFARPDRAAAAQTGKPLAAGQQAPSSAALLRAHAFIRHLQVAVI